jgi:hypothetical protein
MAIPLKRQEARGAKATADSCIAMAKGVCSELGFAQVYGPAAFDRGWQSSASALASQASEIMRTILQDLSSGSVIRLSAASDGQQAVDYGCAKPALAGRFCFCFCFCHCFLGDQNNKTERAEDEEAGQIVMIVYLVTW